MLVLEQFFTDTFGRFVFPKELLLLLTTIYFRLHHVDWVWVTDMKEVELSEDKLTASEQYADDAVCIYSTNSVHPGNIYKYEFMFMSNYGSCNFLGIFPKCEPSIKLDCLCQCGGKIERYGLTHSRAGKFESSAYNDKNTRQHFILHTKSKILMTIDLIQFTLHFWVSCEGEETEVEIPISKSEFYIACQFKRGPVTVKFVY